MLSPCHALPIASIWLSSNLLMLLLHQFGCPWSCMCCYSGKEIHSEPVCVTSCISLFMWLKFSTAKKKSLHSLYRYRVTVMVPMQALSGTRLAEVLRTHFILRAPAAPRSDPAPALRDPAPALREAAAAPALLTAGAAATAALRADRPGRRDVLDAGKRSAMAAPAAAGRGVPGRIADRRVSVQQGVGALPQRRRSLAPPAGVGLGRGARDPRPAGPAAPQQRAQPAPAQWRTTADKACLGKGVGVQGAGVRPAGRARTPLRPLPLGEQVPDMRHGTAGAHEPAWQAAEAGETCTRGAAPGAAWDGAAPEGQLASGWANPGRARAASEPANAAAEGVRMAPKRALDAEGPPEFTVERAPVRGVPGQPPSRPLYAHLSLDRLRGSDPGSRPGPDLVGPAAAWRVYPGSLDVQEPVARELPGVRPVSGRAGAERLDPSGQAPQAHDQQLHSAVSGQGQAAHAGTLHTGPGRRRAGMQSLSEIAGEPLEALLRL